MSIIILLTSYPLAFYLRFLLYPYEPANLDSLLSTLPWLIGWGLLLLYIYDFLPYRRLDREERVASIILVVALQLLGGMALSYFLRTFAFPRSVFLLAAIIQLLTLLVCFYLKDRNQPSASGAICLSAHLTPAEQAALLLTAWKEGRKVEITPSLDQLLVLGGRIERAGNELRIVLKPQGRSIGIKRLLDFGLALVLLLLTLPLFPLLALAIKLDSPGPVFYRQQRVTLGGRAFWLYKFRTMRVDAEAATGPVLATRDDPRITRIGKWLRQTRLDELPQLWNVLKGDMSLVGPRPERPEFVRLFQEQIPGYELRHTVRAGLTGLAQVSAGYDLPAEEKLKYDLAYINSWNLWEDLKIILKTLRTILIKRGAL